MNRYNNRLHILKKEHESLISRKNKMIFSENGIFERYKYPIPDGCSYSLGMAL